LHIEVDQSGKMEKMNVQVGKKSAAHFKAYGVYKGFQKADRILTAEDILALIQ